MSAPRTTYHRGIRCGQPWTPLVAQITVRCWSTNARSSSWVIWICSRRLMRGTPSGAALPGDELGAGADRLGGVAHGIAGVSGIEDHRVAGFLERLPNEPVDARETELDDQRAVLQLGDDVALLAGPSCAFGRYPHPSPAGGRNLAGPGPAIDVS